MEGTVQPSPPAPPQSSASPSPPRPVTPDVALAEQLARCHQAIAECFVCSNCADFSLMSQLECLNSAERLIRVSIALAKAMDKSGKEFTHRIIVERPEKVVEIIHGNEQFPHPPIRKLKTIPGVDVPRNPDIE